MEPEEAPVIPSEESVRARLALVEVIRRRASETPLKRTMTRQADGSASDLFWFLFELLTFGLILATAFFIGYIKGFELALKGG